MPFSTERIVGGKSSSPCRSASSGGRIWLLGALPGCRIRRLLLALSFLDTLCTRVGISQGYNQAFIQTDSELRYLVDGASGNHFAEALPEDNGYEDIGDNAGIKVLKSPIRFEPPELDFKEQPIGLPVLRKVKVFNLNAQSSIQMLSISGNTIHFHCSFFKDKVIPPSGNTSFDVVFLGREEGIVENTLYIHTSAGSFRFQVRAVGTPNPYRLKPLVGVRMPLNSSYSPLIQLHNPHSEPIQVLEMYSSGGDLHLELPGGETEGPQTLWQIPPYQTKSVMKANFVARLENNHTAYIRIKTNTTGAEFLYLPLEVEVSSQPGIYCPQELIDFGLIPSNSEPKSLKLFVLNSGSKSIPVQNVIATPVTEAVTINFHPIKISPDTLRPTVIAEVTFDPSLVAEDGLYTGKIVIKSKNSQFKVTIPYRAHVLSGHLFVNESVTHFHLKNRWGFDEQVAIGESSYHDSFLPSDTSSWTQTDTKENEDGDYVDNPMGMNDDDDSKFFADLDDNDKPPSSPEWTLNTDYYNKMTRNFTVTNHFKVAVAIHNVSLAPEAEKYFSLEETFSPTILPAGKSKNLLVLSLKPDAWIKRTLNSFITIHTNISSINIPLVCFHGKVERFFPGSPSQNILDYGTLGMQEKRDHFFTILNKNPVTLNLKSWGANLTGSLVELMGVEQGTEADILRRANFSDMTRRLKIPPGHYMVFRVGIFTPIEEGETNATVFVETDYHAFRVPFKFRVAKGSLNTVPRELIFDSAFPGKHVELKLKVYSSFSEEMITDSVSTVPFNPQFRFEHAVADGRTVIMSAERSYIGKVIFDPAAGCLEEESCYSGFPIVSKLGKEWYKSTTLQDSPGESDVPIAHTLYNRYLASTQLTSGLSSFNITLNLDTNHVRGFLFNARAKLTWPRVTKPEVNVFPLTQVGNYSYKDVVLVNPSDRKMYFHLVPLDVYPGGAKVVNLLPAWTKLHLKDIPTTSSYASDGEKDVSFTSVPPATFRVMTIHEEGRTGNDTCGGSSTLQSLSGFSDDFESKFDVALHQDTKGFILEPGRKARVRIRFAPETVYNNFKQCLLVRNNLTGIEIVAFAGESVLGEFKFGKFRHDHHLQQQNAAHPRISTTSKSTTPEGEEGESAILEFDMKEKHLKDCDRARQTRYTSPVLSVKRSFRLKNTGLTPIWFAGFDVEGVPCEGYGFKVLNCEGFNLEPSGTRDIDIAFSPDFTLSRVSRQLTLRTSINGGMAAHETGGNNPQGLVNYTLVATLPPHMLAVCGSILPRPGWEGYLFYSINIFMCFALVVVLVAAIMESDRIVRFTSGIFQPAVLLHTGVNTSGQEGNTNLQHHPGQLLDLKSIPAKVNQEIGSQHRHQTNFPYSILRSNNDDSTSLRHRRGQGGNMVSSIINPPTFQTQNTARRRNTSQDNNTRSSSNHHHSNTTGSNSNSISTSSTSSSSSILRIISNNNIHSNNLLTTKEILDEQNPSATWRVFTTRGLISILINFMTWPYLLYKFWKYTTQDDTGNISNTNNRPKLSEQAGNTNENEISSVSPTDVTEIKESPIPGTSNKSKKKIKNSVVTNNSSKKKMSVGQLPSSKIAQTSSQQLDDETSSTTTDASNDVDPDVANTSLSGKISEIEDYSYEFLPGLLSSTPSGNKKGKKKRPQPQAVNNIAPTTEKIPDQSKKNSSKGNNKKELNNSNTTGNKSSQQNMSSESNSTIKEANKKSQKMEEGTKQGSSYIGGTTFKPNKQQAKVRPNEASQYQENKAGIISNNPNAYVRALSRNSDTSSGGDSTPPPPTSCATTPPITSQTSTSFGISTNGSLASPGFFSISDHPIPPNNQPLAGQKQKKITPVGKILPEIKKPENKGAQYGPVGAKPSMPISPLMATNAGAAITNKRSSTPWNMDLGANSCNNSHFGTPGKPLVNRQNSSPSHNGGNSGLAYINQAHPMTSIAPSMPPPGFFNNHSSLLPHQQKSHLSSALSIDSATISPSRRVEPTPICNIDSSLGGGLTNHNSAVWGNADRNGQQENPENSWMIGLQEERRKRTQEYLKKNGTDWPGFGSGPTSGIGFTIDDLWDDPASAAGERQPPSGGGLNPFNLSSFNNTPQHQINTSSAATPGVPTPSWNTFNEVWPSSPADPYWTPTSDASTGRSGTFGALSTGSADTGGLGNSNLNLNPTLSSIWNTPATTTNDDMQKLKSPNDFSQPPPSTSSWPMYQQQQKRNS